MKKVLSIFAVAVMCVGLFSCEDDSSIEETQALYENLSDSDATDGGQVDNDDRD
ncbi:hypothetical protein [Poritiphilus flavus]|uniref:Uncharacterized protein n=1 Tax=Poritiphilus flavus TaxID=2697053 RepID=A0A6L9EFC4_9FLAO|nr:hypothetical protein [Poritiphilus flavus]NAS13416.1 hypothetical protein [Poritiphilus flavus]